jgi:hypothetical protein
MEELNERGESNYGGAGVNRGEKISPEMCSRNAMPNVMASDDSIVILSSLDEASNDAIVIILSTRRNSFEERSTMRKVHHVTAR